MNNIFSILSHKYKITRTIILIFLCEKESKNLRNISEGIISRYYEL